MGDFERTFGAGSDAVSIIEGFSRAAARERTNSRRIDKTSANPSPIGRPELKQGTCSRCNGAGILRHYKHIEGGRCFSCNGAGVVRVEKQPKFQPAPLYVTLREVQNLAPKHDSFGDLTKSFRKNYAELTSGFMGPNEYSTRVSIGDVAKAFDPCNAIELALQIPRVDRKTILRIALVAAERAAEIANEPSLTQAVSEIQKKIDLPDDGSIIQTGPLVSSTDTRPARDAKYCRDFLIRMADKKYAVDPYDVSKFASMTMVQARYVFQAIARAQGTDGQEAFVAEKKRQADDVIAVSPLSEMRS